MLIKCEGKGGLCLSHSRVCLLTAGTGRTCVLSVEVISLYVGSNLRLPLVSIVEELLLVVEQFFMGLGGKLKVRTLRGRGQRPV